MHQRVQAPRVPAPRVGRRVDDECLHVATDAGYSRMTLWTNDPLVAARQVHLSRGFHLVHQEPHLSFDVDLVGQIYQRDLVGEDRTRPARNGWNNGPQEPVEEDRS